MKTIELTHKLLADACATAVRKMAIERNDISFDDGLDFSTIIFNELFLKDETNEKVNDIPKLTKDEINIIGNIDAKYSNFYIARDKDGDLGIYETKPYRVGDVWTCEKNAFGLEVFNENFEFIKWEDEKHYTLGELYFN